MISTIFINWWLAVQFYGLDYMKRRQKCKTEIFAVICGVNQFLDTILKRVRFVTDVVFVDSQIDGPTYTDITELLIGIQLSVRTTLKGRKWSQAAVMQLIQVVCNSMQLIQVVFNSSSAGSIKPVLPPCYDEEI